MQFADPDCFDPYNPSSFKGEQSEWTRRANEYLVAKVREMRERQASLNLTPGASSDLDVVFSGAAGDSGSCTDGVLEMDSEREAIIQRLLAEKRKDVHTGLGGL